ncbi:hypothetical protein [Pseudoalteromonas luteoviolacea]|uniref:Uncharacterized protein n=1 Tax=Pseudoalteromonas luteoviolacea (strain 2ta16) TaxID=1353533 RepID=V4HUY3_PSEL2|nr:hypothetical protein [Pseudoalteromonas luteoviolacea]ESP94635.1 hypothetical protein PL2TA16_00635 [Pseudoalteromonas luteoviolacea 2ta16]KZN32334.1 hypothetical protein N483_04055 [Pseudoalteromonas luteoviolacea NCIMB 1944]
MVRFLIFVLMLWPLSAVSLDISCPTAELDLSKIDHRILSLKASNNGKRQTSYTVTFPAKFNAYTASSALLQVGDKVDWQLLAPLALEQAFHNDEELSVYVAASSSFSQRKYVQITYGSCLSQTIELP